MNKINKDVDYKKMAGSARLVMLGESSHNPAIYKYEAIKALRQLKAAGFTHFAIEMLPRSMQEKVEFYQRTGKGFGEIQKYFDDNWAWGYTVPAAYGELVKSARDIGLKIVALDLTLDEMDSIDSSCPPELAKEKDCLDSHSNRNQAWVQNISTILRQASNNRVIAFMHRWHALRATPYQEGLDTLVVKEGISKIRYIDFIGGIACYSKRSCEGLSDEQGRLKSEYFYRESTSFETAIKTYQVHLPEKNLMLEGTK
ncbi:hypothetical protein W04_2122 [Pseudoalteromonas sp. SW0106-04]|uniref:ChaN family lipoprotein n=1 Tax=Pseudoalteromonas sp. SW0106-04 TaxID=1702169 RepID=UPI0006B46826|nr:ChaN family lipoprotein [Pseudoalteromonas sp. SW0106-04]GAP75591.1 hypothetical protein W04_2122 [Pseudoalteromonas sp. SW0106-04]